MHIVIILFFLMVSVCHAEEPVTYKQELDEVVVTASRVEEKVKEVPSTLNIVDSEELDDIKFRNPAEVLNRLPGIYTSNFGGESELTSIRVPTHFTNPYTVVLVDGIPTSTYGSGSSGKISETNSRNIERIEVVKGPASALYGSNAIGGIINIITKDPSPGSEVNVWSELGEHQHFHSGVSASGSGKKVSYNVDLNYKNVDGWRDNSEVDKKVGSAKLQFAPTESSLLGVKLELLSFDNESSGSLEEDAFNQDWQHSYYTFTETTMDKYVGTLTYDYFLKNAEFRTILSVRKMDHTTLPHYRIDVVRGNPAFNPHVGDYHGFFNDIEGIDTNLQLLYSRNMELWRSKLIVGVDGEYGSTETDTDELEIFGRDPLETLYTYTSYSVIGPTGDNALLDVTTKVASPYMQISASPLELLRITAGGRYDTVTYEVEDKLNAGTVNDLSGEKDFSEFSPKVGVTYEITKNINSYASYSEGFVVPTTSQLFTSGRMNPELEPEEATNYEIGMRSLFWNGKLDLDIAAYYMEIEDKILAKSWTSQYFNVAETSMKGIETVLVLHPATNFSLAISYTYARNKYEDYVVTERIMGVPTDVDYSGNTQVRSPEHHINARLTWMPIAGFKAEIEVDDVSSQYADVSNEESYSRPTLVNLRANYDWKDWSFWAHVTNLTDEKYASYVSGDAGDVGYYSGRPRTFFAGLSYTWGK